MEGLELVDREKAVEVLCIQFVALSNLLQEAGIIQPEAMLAEMAKLTAIIDQRKAADREAYLEGLPENVREIVRQFIEEENPDDGS